MPRLLRLSALLLVFFSFGACDGSVDTDGGTTPTSDAGDSPGPDAGTELRDAGPLPDGGPLGEAIEATAGEWTWVGFEDAACGNGESTGIGVNLSEDSPNVFIFLQGGGACWDFLTCYTLGLATNLESGYGEADFQAEQDFLGLSLFDRSDATNPLRDWSYVYVPYCTGDVHAGDNVASHGGTDTYHVGGANFAAYLRRLVATFSDPERVVISGASAGGYGAAFNFLPTRAAFPDARVELIDDSGPILPRPFLSANREASWRSAWALALPADCAGCDEELSAYVPYIIAQAGADRVALLSYTEDQVIAGFHSIGGEQMSMAIDQLREDAFEGADNAHVFYTEGRTHTMFANPRSHSTGDVTALDWVLAMLNGDEGWGDVVP